MRMGLVLAATLVSATVGCVGLTDLLNPTFLAALSPGGGVADAPGEAPLVVLEVENGTSHVVEYRLTWRDSEGDISERTGTLAAGGKYAEAVICPVQEMTLGDVSNLNATSAVVRLGDGSVLAPFVEVEPFGVLLQDGINYNCGDVVTFRVLPSQATASGYQIFAFIRRAGASGTDGTGGSTTGGDGTTP